MVEQDGVLMPPENPHDFLKIAPEIEKIAEIDFVPLLNKDSTNMLPEDWTEIAKAIYNRRHGGYAGFVIAHGTDTMHFSASAVAFVLGSNLNFPVVFTGAQTIPMVLHGDARVNLVRAVKIASLPLEDRLAEVVISFGDYIFRGCRTQKKDEKRFDAFESPALYPIGNIMENIVIHPIARKVKRVSHEIDFKPNFAADIVQISLIPGLNPQLFMPLLEEARCKGVVLQSFGAGNVPDVEGYAFNDFISQATEQGIPVIVASQFPANTTFDTHYEPGLKAIQAGAIPTGNMTNACATVKFRWVLAQVEERLAKGEAIDKVTRVRGMMKTVYVDEMDIIL